MVSSFTNVIKKGTQFEFEAGRYILIAALSCPFACRALVARQIKGLSESIEVEIVDPRKSAEGKWKFDTAGEIPLTTKDKFGHAELKEYYLKSDADYSGAISVPVLYDTKSKKIVNNESADIIRVFNEIAEGPDLYPESLRSKIDEVNGITGALGMHLYKTLVVKTKEEYDASVKQVYEVLGKMDALLSKSKYLAGDAITEADIRIFSWIYPDDAVSQKRLNLKWTTVETKFPHVARLGKQIYALPGIPSVLSAEHINISSKSPMFANWALLGERNFE